MDLMAPVADIMGMVPEGTLAMGILEGTAPHRHSCIIMAGVATGAMVVWGAYSL